MKKLLIASAVLVGLSSASSFASSDTWSGTVTLQMPNQCELSNSVITQLGGTPGAEVAGTPAATSSTGGTSTYVSTIVGPKIDANDNGLLDEAFSLTVRFDKQSFCNYTHSFSVQRRYGGFTNDTVNNDAISAQSDAFLSAIPYALTIVTDTWDATAVAGIDGLTQKALADVGAIGSGGLTLAATTADATLTDTVPSIPPFHNDTLAANGNATDGLQMTLAYTSAADVNAIPFLEGDYVEELLVKIGGTI